MHSCIINRSFNFIWSLIFYREHHKKCEIPISLHQTYASGKGFEFKRKFTLIFQIIVLIECPFFLSKMFAKSFQVVFQVSCFLWLPCTWDTIKLYTQRKIANVKTAQTTFKKITPVQINYFFKMVLPT